MMTSGDEAVCGNARDRGCREAFLFCVFLLGTRVRVHVDARRVTGIAAMQVSADGTCREGIEEEGLMSIERRCVLFYSSDKLQSRRSRGWPEKAWTCADHGAWVLVGWEQGRESEGIRRRVVRHGCLFVHMD